MHESSIPNETELTATNRNSNGDAGTIMNSSNNTKNDAALNSSSKVLQHDEQQTSSHPTAYKLAPS